MTATDLTHQLPGRITRIPPAQPAALTTDRGETVVAPRVVATIARRAAGEVEGVEIVDASGLRGVFGGASGASADVAARETALDLRLAICWPAPIPLVVEQVRRHVRARVQELTGYVVTDVDIVVSELPAPSKPKRRVI